jgi:2-keto-4-pentenoate hydratase/2-oxohepta-3-ene-1,7-dioic acid hydratase in catechol pathway
MKLIRFGPPGKERPAILDASGIVRDASALVSDWSGSALTADSLSWISRTDLSRLPEAPSGSRLGSPITAPGKIVCVGLNYADHAAETGFELPREPLIFFKSPTALSGPSDAIVIPRMAKAVDWEVELAVVIGDVARNVRPEEAMSRIAGLAVANDLTDRGWQFDRGGQWSKAKSADTFAPLGPWLVTLDELPATLDLGIWLEKNSEVRQESRTGRMIFSISQIVAHLSEFMTLVPGDLILCGTPDGVAYNKPDPDFLREGDIIACGIEGLGSQRCIVHDEERISAI